MARLTSAEFWDRRWGKTHNSGRTINAQEFKEFLSRVLEFVPIGGSVLELGAAPGLLALRYHELRPDLVLDGLDISAEGIAHAHKLYQEHGIQGVIRNEDMFDAQIDARYDLVSSHGLIEHFDDFDNAIAAHFKFVRPGGIVAITVPNYAHVFVRSLLRLCSEETIRTHNFACMSQAALAGALGRVGAQAILVGTFGGAIIPNSAPNRGFAGALFKRFAQAWNLIATLAARLGATPRFWDAQVFIVAR